MPDRDDINGLHVASNSGTAMIHSTPVSSDGAAMQAIDEAFQTVVEVLAKMHGKEKPERTT